VSERGVTITFTTPDGEERDERWPNPEAFRSWAVAESLTCTFTAYEEDEDGDLIVVAKGTVE
jgi:hypothetical protein